MWVINKINKIKSVSQNSILRTIASRHIYYLINLLYDIGKMDSLYYILRKVQRATPYHCILFSDRRQADRRKLHPQNNCTVVCSISCNTAQDKWNAFCMSLPSSSTPLYLLSVQLKYRTMLSLHRVHLRCLFAASGFLFSTIWPWCLG